MKLTDEFDNDDINHFTVYDYILQVVENGQLSSFKETIKKLDDDQLVTLLEILEKGLYKSFTSQEIVKRMTK